MTHCNGSKPCSPLRRNTIVRDLNALAQPNEPPDRQLAAKLCFASPKHLAARQFVVFTTNLTLIPIPVYFLDRAENR